MKCQSSSSHDTVLVHDLVVTFSSQWFLWLDGLFQNREIILTVTFVVFGFLVCSRPWIGRKRPWTWLHLLLNNYWNKKSEFSSVYFNCFSNLTFQDDYWQTVKKVCRPKATVPGYAVRRWPGSKNHNVSMTGKAGEAEGSPRLMITSTHTNHQKKVKKVTEWGCRFKGKQSDRLQFGN